LLVESLGPTVRRLLDVCAVLTAFCASSLLAQDIMPTVSGSPSLREASEPLFEIARIQTELNEFNDAQQNYLAGIELLIQENGGYSPSLIEPYTELAQTFILNGEHREAITTLEQAQHISQRNFGLLNMDQVSLLDEMSNAYLLMGNTILAENIQQERLTLALRRYGEDDPQVIPFRRHLAIYYDLSRMRGRAREQFEDILDIQQQNFEEFDGRQLSTLSELVRIDILLGNPNSSRRRLLTMLESRDNIAPTEVGNALAILGDWDLARGQTETALQYYRDAYKVLNAEQPSLATEYFSTPRLINFIPPPSPVDRQGNHTRYIWGWMSARFNISSLGMPNNIEIIDSSPSRFMNSLYTSRLSEAVYRPRLVDGEPSNTTAVTYSHQFRSFIGDD
jgi:tetratricopeptide (TPR) repeat protein